MPKKNCAAPYTMASDVAGSTTVFSDLSPLFLARSISSSCISSSSSPSAVSDSLKMKSRSLYFLTSLRSSGLRSSTAGAALLRSATPFAAISSLSLRERRSRAPERAFLRPAVRPAEMEGRLARTSAAKTGPLGMPTSSSAAASVDPAFFARRRSRWPRVDVLSSAAMCMCGLRTPAERVTIGTARFTSGPWRGTSASPISIVAGRTVIGPRPVSS
mmetsp:Transcript_23284/g.50197  ORF Transcript_23284/g.50197 Transcript_23284/m.50197 type:complete len:216 (+) Transcript_23284:476-1123(+)